MKLAAQTLTIGPPHAHGLEPAREEIRHRQLEHARRAGWPQLNHDDLTFHRYFVEHRPSGELFTMHRGELVDALYLSAAAYCVNERGQVVFPERPPGGPTTRAELEQRQAEHRQRRNAPKPRRRATRR